MSIPDFIENFILPNSLVRLWMPYEQGHKLLLGPVMEWEILLSGCFEDEVSIFEVVGVTDIFCENYREAVNIVVKIKE